MRRMDKATFDKFRKIVYDKSGISLRPDKESLVVARVGKRMRKLEITDHRQYLRYLLDDSTGTEVVHLIDAISTNVTSFFREPHHFEFLTEVFRGWLAAGQSRFRFWSAASSTGEEPYTLAMTLLEAIDGYHGDLRILATDISTRVLDVCRAGVYDEEKLKTVPKLLRARYFDRPDRNGTKDYKVKDILKRVLVFERINLSTPPYPMRGPLDAIFCRNVMIYFDKPVREKFLAEAHRLIKPGGYLMVGHAENLTGLSHGFRVVKPSIYLKPGG